MGNQLASTKPVASPSDYFLHDLPNNVVYKETLGSGRFLKTLQCFHEEGIIVVKVYFKRGELSDVKKYERRLVEIRELLSGIEQSHVWPFQRWLETDKAAYVLRQHFHSNLHDRLSTRPFLSLIEKKWIAFQLLKAVEQCHSKDVCHGDIKCENVLVTSWNWIYLADFASFKPTYLPADNPADFSFFFDTGGRRRCYLAPERFYDSSSKASASAYEGAILQPASDVFSLGCVIAEVFLEGEALFDLSTLLAYRSGKHDVMPTLSKVPDNGIRDLILHMIQLSPCARLSAGGYLQQWAPLVFPTYFSPYLHDFFSCLIPMDTDVRVAFTQESYPEIRKRMMLDALGREGGRGGGAVEEGQEAGDRVPPLSPSSMDAKLGDGAGSPPLSLRPDELPYATATSADPRSSLQGAERGQRAGGPRGSFFGQSLIGDLGRLLADTKNFHHPGSTAPPLEPPSGRRQPAPPPGGGGAAEQNAPGDGGSNSSSSRNTTAGGGSGATVPAKQVAAGKLFRSGSGKEARAGTGPGVGVGFLMSPSRRRGALLAGDDSSQTGGDVTRSTAPAVPRASLSSEDTDGAAGDLLWPIRDGHFLVDPPRPADGAGPKATREAAGPAAPSSSSSSSSVAVRSKASAAVLAEAAMAVDEVVTEEVYESQVREPGGSFGERPFNTGDPLDWAMPGLGRRKEDITLPPEGGWRWEGEWEVDSHGGPGGVGADENGWRYLRVSSADSESYADSRARSGGGGGEEPVGMMAPGGSTRVPGQRSSARQVAIAGRAWSSTCTLDCLWRRRRWVRKRRRRPPYPTLFLSPAEMTGGGAAARRGQLAALDLGDGGGGGGGGSEGGSRRWRNGDKGVLPSAPTPPAPACEGMVLVAALLCACLRNVRLPQSRRACVELLRRVAAQCDDDARLQLIIPYVVALLPDLDAGAALAPLAADHHHHHGHSHGGTGGGGGAGAGIGNSAAVVRCAALRAVADVLAMVRTFPLSDAKIFPEYVLPSLSLLPRSADESVRIAYADCIATFAQTAQRFLETSHRMTQAALSQQGGGGGGSGGVGVGEAPPPPLPTPPSGGGDVKVGGGPLKNGLGPGPELVTPGAARLGAQASGAAAALPPGTRSPGGGTGGRAAMLHCGHTSFGDDLAHLREAVKQVVEELVTGPRSTPAVRRALLCHTAPLCHFFDRKYSNDFFLPLLITFLNDRDDQVRAAFFEQIPHIHVVVGRESLEAFLVPCIEQALLDSEEAVIVNALACLAALCVREQLRKRVLLQACERAAPLLCHPSPWVRRSAVAFMAAAGAALDAVDAHAYLAPLLAPLLTREPAVLSSEAAIMACLKPPMAKLDFTSALSDAMLSSVTADEAERRGAGAPGRRGGGGGGRGGSGGGAHRDAAGAGETGLGAGAGEATLRPPSGRASRSFGNLQTADASPGGSIKLEKLASGQVVARQVPAAGEGAPAEGKANARASGGSMKRPSSVGSTMAAGRGGGDGAGGLGKHPAAAEEEEGGEQGEQGEQGEGEEGEDEVKLRAMQGYIQSASTVLHSKMKNWETDNSERLRASTPLITAAAAAVPPPGVGAGVGLGLLGGFNLQPGFGVYPALEKPAPGIPVYSVVLSDRRPENGRGPSEDWSRVFGVRSSSSETGVDGDGEPPSVNPAASGLLRPATRVLSQSYAPDGGLSLSLASDRLLPGGHHQHNNHQLLLQQQQQQQHLQRSISILGGLTPRTVTASMRSDGGLWERVPGSSFGGGLLPVSSSSAMVSASSSSSSSGAAAFAAAAGTPGTLRSSRTGGATPGGGMLGVPREDAPPAENARSHGLMVDAATGVVGTAPAAAAGGPDSTWRPRGVLIAHLQEHQRGVNALAVAPDSLFFASASDDGTIRIWDCRRVERDISFRSRLTYAPFAPRGVGPWGGGGGGGGAAPRATAVAALEGHMVAAAFSSGAVHVFRADHCPRSDAGPERWAGVADIRKIEPEEGPPVSLQALGSGPGPPLVLYSTLRGVVHAWDLRTHRDAWSLQLEPAWGYVRGSAVDALGNWVVTGTSRGVLTLWDLRFRLPVNTWQHPGGGPVDAVCALLPGVGALIAGSELLSRSTRPLVYVAAGENEVALYNAEDGQCHQVLRVASKSAESERAALLEVPAALAPPKPGLLPLRGQSSSSSTSTSSSAAPAAAAGSSSSGAGDRGLQGSIISPAAYGVEELNAPPPRHSGMRALLPLAGGAGLLTGGSDCCIRLWDRLRMESSYWVCGPTPPHGGRPPVRYDSRVIHNVRILQEVSPASREQPGPSATAAAAAAAGGGGGGGMGGGLEGSLAAAALDSAGCHRDAILSLATAQVSQRILISCSRDGAIKVWK